VAFGEARHSREGITMGNVGDGGRGRRLRSSGEAAGASASTVGGGARDDVQFRQLRGGGC